MKKTNLVLLAACAWALLPSTGVAQQVLSVANTTDPQPADCSNPTSPTGHATCLGIPNGPKAQLGDCLGGSGPCDPLNWNHDKFSTIGVVTSPTRIDYYYVAHNNRIFHNYQNPSTGAWGDATSSIMLSFPEDGAAWGYNTTVGLGTVLHQPGVEFTYPGTSVTFDYAMYFVYQFDPIRDSAGHVCVTFSDSATGGWVWPPIRVLDAATASSSLCDEPIDCHDPATALDPCRLQVEAFSGFLVPDPKSAAGTALFAGLEGYIPELACTTYPNDGGIMPPKGATTATSLYKLSTDQPSVVETMGLLPTTGMNSPTFVSPDGNASYQFTNLDFVYDPYHEQVLISRVYPFPFDHFPENDQCRPFPLPWGENILGGPGIYTPDGNAPCDPSTTVTNICPTHVGTHPMRAQVYSNYLRTEGISSIDDSIESLLNGGWTLEADWGRDSGWATMTGVPATCGSRFPTNAAFQQDIGIDLDSLGFLRTPEGWLPEGSSIRTYLGGFLDRNDACQDATFHFQPFVFAHEYTRLIQWDHLFKDGFESGTLDAWDLD